MCGYYPGMGDGETELEMVQRHIREGYAHVARQREIIAELRASGHSVDLAEALLVTFLTAQASHEDHLARITTGRH